MDSEPVTVTALDHIVLRCADVETTLDWYVNRLGMAPLRVEEWRAGQAPFPSVRVDGNCIIDLIEGDSRAVRLDHFCLVIEATDLHDLAASGQFDVLEGPVVRFGARGNGHSLYVRDPDGTTVELRCYP